MPLIPARAPGGKHDQHHRYPRDEGAYCLFGVGGAGGNAINNMIAARLQGVDFIVANTDAQALTMSMAERVIQMAPG